MCNGLDGKTSGSGILGRKNKNPEPAPGNTSSAPASVATTQTSGTIAPVAQAEASGTEMPLSGVGASNGSNFSGGVNKAISNGAGYTGKRRRSAAQGLGL